MLTLVLRDGVRPVKDGVPRLHVQQVKLHRVARVHVAVREKQLSAQQQRLAHVDALLAEGLRRLHPVHCGTRVSFQLLFH